MWGTIVNGIIELAGSWFEKKKAEQKAEANFKMKMAEAEATWDLVALRQAQYSLKDELITIIIFAPLILAWFPPMQDNVDQWIEFVSELPYWYQFIMYGVIAASFGLRWFFKQQNFKVPGK